MALSHVGAGLALVDAGNGKLTVKWDATGNPAFDDSQGETVFSLLMESPWFGDRQKKRRSKISTIKTNDSSTPGRLVQYAKDALQPAIDDGRLKSIVPSVQRSGSGYLLAISYVTGSGKQSAISIPLSV